MFIRHSYDDILTHFTALSQCESDGVWKARIAGYLALLKEALDSLVDEGDEDLLKIAMTQAGVSPIQRYLSPIVSPSKCGDISDLNVVISPVTSTPGDVHSSIVADAPSSDMTENEMSSDFIEVVFGDCIEIIQALSIVEVGDTLDSEILPCQTQICRNCGTSGGCFHEHTTWRRNSSNDERDRL